jgi:hypothetical protein
MSELNTRRGGLRRTATMRYNERRFGGTRLDTRLRVDYCPLLFKKDGVRPAGFRRGITGDLSRSGLFLGDSSYLEVGATIQLLIRLPDVAANPIACFAKVVRKDLKGRQGYGLRFMRLPPRDRDRLEGYVDELEAWRCRAAAGA